MEDLFIDIIYDLLKDQNLYNYNNKEELKTAEIKQFTNLENDQVIQIKVGKEYYIIHCFKSFVERGEE